MSHYTNIRRQEKICDTLDIGDFDCHKLTSGKILGQAKYRNLGFKISELPHLMAKLTPLAAGASSNETKFDEFRIVKITYKIKVLNARALSMDPNYRCPDGSGQNTVTLPDKIMVNKHNYVHNSYVFHKRYQNDDLTAFDFTDWKLIQDSMKGACEFVNFFRQKGKMFNTAITADRAQEIYVNNTPLFYKKHGQTIGWQKHDTSLMDLRIGQAGLITPGIHRLGWDEVLSNPNPQVRVSVRVCSVVRANKQSVDLF
jgi:hypothetical protein